MTTFLQLMHMQTSEECMFKSLSLRSVGSLIYSYIKPFIHYETLKRKNCRILFYSLTVSIHRSINTAPDRQTILLKIVIQSRPYLAISFIPTKSTGRILKILTWRAWKSHIKIIKRYDRLSLLLDNNGLGPLTTEKLNLINTSPHFFKSKVSQLLLYI